MSPKNRLIAKTVLKKLQKIFKQEENTEFYKQSIKFFCIFLKNPKNYTTIGRTVVSYSRLTIGSELDLYRGKKIPHTGDKASLDRCG